MDNEKTVFLYTGASVFHTGHFNIIAKAAKLGKLTVGLLCDGVQSGFGDCVTVPFTERCEVISMLKCVDKIVPIPDAEGIEYIRRAHPDIVVHGDNWKIGPLAPYRAEALEVLDSYGGQLVEHSYTRDLYSAQLEEDSRKVMSMPERRRPQLKRMLETYDRPIRVMEAHNGLTGLIVEKSEVEVDGQKRSYDAIWVSSLTDSTAKGKPDTELVDNTSRLETIEQIMEVTTKPIILDGDSGGLIEHFQYLVATLERIGVSAVIIEDKVGLKRNSLFGAVGQNQDTIEHFCEKITAGKSILRTPEFMIIARIESLILEQGMDDAMNRARAYIRAGADGIMIHSRKKDPSEIREFCGKLKAEHPEIPIVVVPTSYNDITEDVLGEYGANIVIHANHLIRAAFPAMVNAAETILRTGRSRDVDDICMPIKQIITLVPAASE